MYTVHMRRVTATQARKDWFRLLDEVAAGEEFVIRRNEVDIILSRRDTRKRKRVPDYSKWFTGLDVSNAHRWTWDWDPETGQFQLRVRPR
jgi:hypothetical protein